jgi:hypothetical protein
MSTLASVVLFAVIALPITAQGQVNCDAAVTEEKRRACIKRLMEIERERGQQYRQIDRDLRRSQQYVDCVNLAANRFGKLPLKVINKIARKKFASDASCVSYVKGLMR